MPYDYTSDEGKVRLLIPDTDECNKIFESAQIAGFIAIARNNNLKRAAALAVDAIATSEALISKVIRSQDVQTDGAKLADALRKHAQSLRDQADKDEEDSGESSFFAIVPFDSWPSRAELTED